MGSFVAALVLGAILPGVAVGDLNAGLSPSAADAIARIQGMSADAAAPGSLPHGFEGDGSWQELPAPPRHGHTAIVDPKRHRIVVLSGFGWTRLNQLWEHPLDLQAQWRPLDVRGDCPSPRMYATAVYDSKRGRALFFGGFDGNDTFNETWELQLNGVPRWRLLSPLGAPPTGRLWHSAIYDAHLDRMIVFGGTDRTNVLNDTWALDLVGRPHWKKLPPAAAAPAPRMRACALYDANESRMLLVGGDAWSGLDSSETVWALDLDGVAAWTRLSPLGPGPEAGETTPGVVDVAGQRALFYSGAGSSVRALTLAEPMTWSVLDPGGHAPRERDEHVVVLDPVERRMWVHGGVSGRLPRADTWTVPLDGSPGWTQVPAEGDADRRSAHTAILDSRRDRMVVYGGHPSWDGPGTAARPDHEVWVQDFAGDDEWRPLEPMGPSPPHRVSHTAVQDSLRDRLIVFGGYGGLTDLNDVWALNFGDHPSWSPLLTQGVEPSPRSASTAICDPVGDRMILFGGGRLLDDTWALPLRGAAVWQPILPDGVRPPGRREHAAVYDATGHRMLVFGGITTAHNYDNDVWALSLDGPGPWQRIVVPGPAPRGRQSPVAVYDPERARLIIHGGYDGSNLIRDAWELSLAGEPRWRELEPAGNVPIFWFDHAAVLDPARRRMVIFGEFGSWSLTWGAAAPGRSVVGHAQLASDRPDGSASRLAIAAATSLPLHGAWNVRVQLPGPGRAVIVARSVSGRIVFAQEIVGATRGTSNVLLAESAACPSGVYFLTLTQGGRAATTKVVNIR